MKLFDALSHMGSAKLTRRTFLKASAGATGLALLGLSGCQTNASGSRRRNARRGAQLSYQTCPRNCHDTCAIISETAEGRITRIKGDPNHPITAGSLCVKMNHYRNWVYHPDRILYPMKRVGTKGEGKFERISWDEALNTIAQNLNEIVSTYGSEAVLPYSYSGNLGYVQNYGPPERFFNRLGASFLARDVCVAAGSAALLHSYGADYGVDPENYAHSKLLVSWGINEAATNVHALKFIQQAQENGAKIVVVNPARTPLANQADMFLQIKPGTDAALALGVINLIIINRQHDQEYINQYTTGFDALVEKAREYPIARVASLTGLTEESIREFAELYGTIKPSIIRIGYGMQRHTNGGSMVRAISMLPAVVGQLGTGAASGYAYINFAYWVADWAALGRPDLLGGAAPRSISMNQLGAALTGALETTKELPVKGLIVFNSNPLAITQNAGLARTGMARDDLFTVVMDIFRTDTVDYADIVIPASTFFEYEDFNQTYLGSYIYHNEPAIQALGESRSNSEFFNALAKRCGFTEALWDDTVEDCIRAALANNHPFNSGATYERLKKEHWIKQTLPVPFADKVFPTPSGKIEFYSESLREKGLHPVADYVPLVESETASPALFRRYPLLLLTPAGKNLLNSQMHNVAHISELMGQPIIFIHPNDAAPRGIQDGSLLEVYNDRGVTRLVARISDKAVKPGVTVSHSSPWPKLLNGTNINNLTHDRLTDIGGGSTYHTNLVEIRRV